MPRPHEQRPSKLRNAASRPGDDADANSGGWSRERLIAMDARYCEVMRAALIKDIGPEGRRKPSSDHSRNGNGALIAAAARR
jgi:hypothetical protein